jgi:transcriptional regulator with XRE-family HTH domain
VRRRVTSSDFGQRLRSARGRAGVTLTSLAARSGVSLSSLSRFESGASQPAFEDVCAIARTLGAPLLYLADGRDRTGNDPRDLIAHLAYWGLNDLAAGEKALIGEARSFEGLIADSLVGATTPRILEGIPALLLKNDSSVHELVAEAARAEVLYRLGWLTEIAEWIAGQISVNRIHPSAFANVREVRLVAWKSRLNELKGAKPSRGLEGWDLIGQLPSQNRTKDDIALREKIPPIASKWRIAYWTPQEDFLARARDILAVSEPG